MFELPRDLVILFATRMVRLFAYGSLSVVLALSWSSRTCHRTSC